MGTESENKRWRVLLLDTKEDNPNHYIVIAIEQALKNHPSVERVQCVSYSDALHVAIRDHCNLFLAFNGQSLDRGLCQRLSVVCGRSVLWVTADPYEIKDNVNNAKLFDLVFTNDSESVTLYSGQASHLPFAAFPKFHHQEIPDKDEGHYLFDLLFVGIARPNRIEFLKALLPGLKGLKFKLGLQNYDPLTQPDLDLPPSSFRWRAANSELAKLVNRSRIVLTLGRGYSGSGESPSSSPPGPCLFETALAGGFQLIDPSIPDAFMNFHPNTEIVGFTDTEDCLEKIRHFLTHPDERLEIARAAQSRCLSGHLYHHRVDSILKSLGELSYRSSYAGIEFTELRKVKKRILYVARNCIGVEPGGGVEIYADFLTKALPDDVEPFIYYPDRRDPSGKSIVLLNVRTQVITDHTFDREYDASFLLDPERENWFRKILHEHRIDLVHVLHQTGHPLSLPLVARFMGIPVLMTVPDYFPVCYRTDLLDPSQQYCNIPKLPLVTCDMCLSENYNANFKSQATRRSFVAAVLQNLDNIIFLSHSERNIVESIYPFLKGDQRVMVEGFPVVEKPPPVVNRSTQEGVLRVAVPGNLTNTTEAKALCWIFAILRNDPIEFHVYGANHIPSISPFFQWLQSLEGPNLQFHGAYSEESLHENLLNAEVALILSIWPKPYGLTLSESWRAGVVPIVTDIGALGERVKDRVNGLKVPVNDPGSVVQLLREFMSDRNELERMRKNIHIGLYCKMNDHIEIMTQLYFRLFERYGVKSGSDAYFRDCPLPRKEWASNVFRMQDRWANVPLFFPGFGDDLNPTSGGGGTEPTEANETKRINREERFLDAKAFIQRFGFKAWVIAIIRKHLFGSKR